MISHPKLLYLFTGYVLLNISGCCCNQEAVDTYSYTSLEEITLSNLDNTGVEAVLQQSDTIPSAAFGLMLSLELWDSVGYAQRARWSGFNRALAFKCESGEFLVAHQDTLQSFSITSTNHFDETHPAGADLRELFTAASFSLDSGWVTQSGQPSNHANYFLIQPPSSTSAHRFIATMVLSDGQAFSDTTSTVVLQN